MAEMRRKFDGDFRQGAARSGPKRHSTRSHRSIGDRRRGSKRAANERDHHCIQCSAGDGSMLSETVHGRLLMTRNARPSARQQV